MQVDWLTVAAQWANFFILALLLKRFLYGPIIRAMDRRQQTIEANLAEARKKIELAEQEAAGYRDKCRELEDHKTALIAEARETAAQERTRLVAQAKAEVDAMAQRWRKEVEIERRTFQGQLRHELGRLVLATSRKALLDLASLELEQALLAHFLERLGELSEQDKHRLASSGRITVASSTELTISQQKRLADRLVQILGHGLQIRFETLSDEVCGFVLLAPAYKLEWRLESYFDELSAELEAALRGSSESQGGSDVA